MQNTRLITGKKGDLEGGGVLSTIRRLVIALIILYVLYLIIRTATDKSFHLLDVIKNLWGPSP